MTIRPMDMQRDIADYARLRSIAEYTVITPEIIRERLYAYRDRLTAQAFVAESGGEVVGFTRWSRLAHEKPGFAQVLLVVDPVHESRGIGRQLYEQLAATFDESGITRPWCFAREDQARGLAFAEQHGYREARRYFESVADLSEFDVSRESAARSHLESLGLTIKRFQVDSSTHPELPALYDLFAEADLDEPSTSVIGVASFDHFAGVFDIAENKRGVTFVAEHEGRYVAMSSTSINDQGEVWNEFTGTRRAWRGKGLAGALKTLVMAEHATRGDREMHTSNNTENAPMLAINRRLGFRNKPAWLILEREEDKTI